eukprot:PITA_27604
MQEASTVRDIARSMPRINVALDDHQAEYQLTMIECEGRWSLIDCKKKSVNYLTEAGQRREIHGIMKNIKLHLISANQLGRCIRNDCEVYVIQLRYTNSKSKTTSLEDIPMIQDFKDVFPEFILVLPSKCDIDFTIELIPSATPVSRDPYRMSILELTKLKMQL